MHTHAGRKTTDNSGLRLELAGRHGRVPRMTWAELRLAEPPRAEAGRPPVSQRQCQGTGQERGPRLPNALTSIPRPHCVNAPRPGRRRDHRTSGAMPGESMWGQRRPSQGGIPTDREHPRGNPVPTTQLSGPPPARLDCLLRRHGNTRRPIGNPKEPVPPWSANFASSPWQGDATEVARLPPRLPQATKKQLPLLLGRPPQPDAPPRRIPPRRQDPPHGEHAQAGGLKREHPNRCSTDNATSTGRPSRSLPSRLSKETWSGFVSMPGNRCLLDISWCHRAIEAPCAPFDPSRLEAHGGGHSVMLTTIRQLHLGHCPDLAPQQPPPQPPSHLPTSSPSVPSARSEAPISLRTRTMARPSRH